ncbi:hypothetical protein QY890_07155 [Latilactobacillus sakei]
MSINSNSAVYGVAACLGPDRKLGLNRFLRADPLNPFHQHLVESVRGRLLNKVVAVVRQPMA